VGACVGMRGNRVRNIVNEMNGEKIDIVRFNDDIREYIKASLSPAKISEIKLDKEKLKAEVVVDNDQLSLAIGKHGQNVRLASRLVGWELDIRTKAPPAQEPKKEEAAKEEPQVQEEVAAAASLEGLPGVGEKTLANLKKAGFKTIDDILQATAGDLIKVDGIGEKKAAKILQEAKKTKAK